MFRSICPTAASFSLGLLLILQAALPASGIELEYGTPTLAPLPGESIAMRDAGNRSEAVSETATAIAPEPDLDAAYAGAGCASCSGAGCGTSCGPTSCPSGDQPFALFGGCSALQQRGIKVGGWLEQGITFNSTNPADRFNGPVATNDRDSEYQMNQFWLYVSRPIDTGGHGWDIGGHIDMLYGSDFRFGINYGLEDRINSVDNPYGMVIPQAYMEIGFNNLSVKLGHFAGILDYEAVPSVANPFYSHSYCYGYTVPQLVTGALADYKLTDRLSIAGGFHRGWMMFEDINHNIDFMGGIKWTSTDKRTNINFGVSTGAQDPAGEQERFVYSLVLKRQVTKKFQYILVHNLGFENDAVMSPGQVREDAEWYGINQYFLYQFNPCWSAGLRFEWLRDDDGARVFGVPNAIPPVKTWPGGPGFAGDFYEVTAGLNWRPHPNVVVRPELRWDWYDGTVDVNNNLPFDGGGSDDQFTFATDVIVTF
jgi:putative OmpL-like beta-barrel porin-2